MTTTVALIRHGVTEWNELNRAQGISDIPLNHLGIKQARELANRLYLERKWDVIITSDLTRAKVTAQIISERLELPVQIYDERIREIHCGDIEGTTEEERLQKWGNNWRELDLGIEKFEEVSKRGSAFLEDAVNIYKGKRILVVSHGALIGLTLQRLLPEQFPSTYIDNTSVTILDHVKQKWECTLYNCTKHLRDKI